MECVATDVFFIVSNSESFEEARKRKIYIAMQYNAFSQLKKVWIVSRLLIWS